MILSLDISTAIIGWATLDNGKLEYGAWDLRDDKLFGGDLFLKTAFVKDQLEVFKDVTKVIVEKPFTVFSGKKAQSSAHTMAILQRFNGMVSYIAFDQFGITPEYITVQEARSKCGIKIIRPPKGKKKSQVDTKRQIVKFLIDTEPQFRVELTPKGNPKPQYYDIADAIVLLKSQVPQS